MKYYIVYGGSGAYSDHTEWPVAVYTDEYTAMEHSRLADETAMRLHFLGWGYSAAAKEVAKPIWKYQTGYCVVEVESDPEHLPEPPAPPGRAAKSGQCQRCCYVDTFLGHGAVMPGHLPFTKDYAMRTRGMYCDGGGKPPRPSSDDDYHGWVAAVKSRGGSYL